jgi:hypothetical protein
MRFALFVICLLMVGCGAETRTEGKSQRDTSGTGRLVTKEVITTVPLENGGTRTERILETITTNQETETASDQAITRTGPDDRTQGLISGIGSLAGQAFSVATGNPSGTLIGTGIAGLLTAAVTAWGASRNAQAKQLREERDFHKDDAEKGWSKFERVATKADPQA